MSLKATTWAWSVQGITTTELVVLLRLADRSRDGSFRCWPSVEGLARDCKICESAARRALQSLKRKGLVVTRSSPGRRPNSYTLAVPNPVAGTPLNPVPERTNGVRGSANPVPECANPVPRTPEALKKLSGNLKAKTRAFRSLPTAAASERRESNWRWGQELERQEEERRYNERHRELSTDEYNQFFAEARQALVRPANNKR